MSNQPLKDLMDKFGSEVVEAAMRNLGATRKVRGKNRRAVASGTLKNSLTYVNRTRYNNPIVQFTASGKAKDYAIFVHEGRRPGATPPPIAPILEWIKIKRLKPKDENGRFIKSTPARLKSMAVAMSKSIGRRGIEPLPYYTEAIDSTLEKFGPDFLEALKKEIEIQLLLSSKNFKAK